MPEDLNTLSRLHLECDEIEAQLKLQKLKAARDRTIIGDGTGFERLKQMADILCELLDLTPGTTEEISHKLEELRGES